MASKVTFNSKKLLRLQQDATLRGIEMLTFSFQKRLRKMLNKPGTGKTYRSGKNGKNTHQASSPGQPPAPRTGRLRDSWVAGRRKRIRKPGKVGISLTQGPSFQKAAKYAGALEYGVPSRGLKKRPFIKPTIKFFRGTRAQRIFSSVFKREIAKINQRGPHG